MKDCALAAGGVWQLGNPISGVNILQETRKWNFVQNAELRGSGDGKLRNAREQVALEDRFSKGARGSELYPIFIFVIPSSAGRSSPVVVREWITRKLALSGMKGHPNSGGLFKAASRELARVVISGTE